MATRNIPNEHLCNGMLADTLSSREHVWHTVNHAPCFKLGIDKDVSRASLNLRVEPCILRMTGFNRLCLSIKICEQSKPHETLG
jgi:hypothetical protein